MCSAVQSVSNATQPVSHALPPGLLAAQAAGRESFSPGYYKCGMYLNRTSAGPHIRRTSLAKASA